MIPGQKIIVLALEIIEIVATILDNLIFFIHSLHIRRIEGRSL